MSTRIKLRSRHQALLWRHSRGGECLKVYLEILQLNLLVSCFITILVYKRKLQKMEFRLHHIIDHLYNIFLENDGSENCAQLIEEEFTKIIGMNDEHDGNVVCMNSLNIHDANDMQSISLGMLCLMKMIFLVPQVLMRKFIMMKACLLFMMIILMKVGLEECQL